MMKYLSIVLAATLLAACQTDAKLKNDFVGRYQVTLRLPEAKKDLAKAKEDIDKEMDKAQEEIKKGIEEAKADIEKEMGEDNHFGDAVGNFVEGMGGLAEGLAKLGEGLGKMGLDLGQGIIDGLKFKAEFREDGNVLFGKRSKIQIGSGDGNFWDIKDGKFYLWENEDEKTAFEMKDTGNGNWELVSEDVIFELERLPDGK